MLCLVALILLGAYYVLSPWIFAEGLKSDPQFSLVPVSLPNKSEARLAGATIESGAFSFQVPKDSEAHKFASGQETVVSLANGWMWIKSPERDAGDLSLRSLVERDKSVQSLLEKESLPSEYQLRKAALSATPQSVTWWRFRFSQNRRAAALLMMKFFVLTYASHASKFRGPIFEISSREMRGFQFGDPDTPPYEAHLDVFDGSNRHFVIDAEGAEGHGRILTQEEINAVVASIRPTAGP